MITKKEVEHIAKLARLSLTKKEKERFQEELSEVLEYIGQLKEVDISGVEPTSHSVFVENMTREDEPKSVSPELKRNLIEAAPEKKEGHIKVKAIL